ncbi:hypothetical protein BDZ89DRAFT_1086680 [Hymenopellis radicata]|nr:hypothetical protein BDZ89DRAFT_1086680 [Hymenopellis radicata]
MCNFVSISLEAITDVIDVHGSANLLPVWAARGVLHNQRECIPAALAFIEQLLTATVPKRYSNTTTTS